MQAAAYICGTKLHESRRNLTASYDHKAVAWRQTLTPEHTPPHMQNLQVWDIFESFEDLYAQQRFPHNLTARDKYLNSAQTAMTIVVALPRELTLEQNQQLLRQFAEQRFVARGLIVTAAIHYESTHGVEKQCVSTGSVLTRCVNPHGHLQIARRAIDNNGQISWTKDREVCSRKELLITRNLWAELTNQHLQQAGIAERITAKSFMDLGVDLDPTYHMGAYGSKIAK